MEDCISAVWNVEKGSVLRIREGGVSTSTFINRAEVQVEGLTVICPSLVDWKYPSARKGVERAGGPRPAGPVFRQRRVCSSSC